MTEKLHSKEQGAYRPIPLQGNNPPKPNDRWPYHNHPTTPHDPEFGIKDPKIEKRIFIRSDQVFYDIDAQLGIIAKARRKSDGTEDDSIAQATTMFRPMFVRWIDTYIGKAKAIMSAFVLEQYRETIMNSIKDKEEVEITLLLPEWYDDTTFPQLCDAVHNYVVNGTMQEYAKLSFTSKDPMTVDKYNDMIFGESEIRKLCNAAKAGYIHKKYKPFG